VIDRLPCSCSAGREQPSSVTAHRHHHARLTSLNPQPRDRTPQSWAQVIAATTCGHQPSPPGAPKT
jgi:hypothetical protein